MIDILKDIKSGALPVEEIPSFLFWLIGKSFWFLFWFVVWLVTVVLLSR